MSYSLAHENKRVVQLAEEFGVSVNTIYEKLKKNNIDINDYTVERVPSGKYSNRCHAYHPSLECELRNIFKQTPAKIRFKNNELSQKDIAETIGVTENTVGVWAKKTGLRGSVVSNEEYIEAILAQYESSKSRKTGVSVEEIRAKLNKLRAAKANKTKKTMEDKKDDIIIVNEFRESNVVIKYMKNTYGDKVSMKPTGAMYGRQAQELLECLIKLSAIVGEANMASVSKELGALDHYLADVNHDIEVGKLSKENAAEVYTRMSDILRKRREVKNFMQTCQSVRDKLRMGGDSKQFVKNISDRLRAQYYCEERINNESEVTCSAS